MIIFFKQDSETGYSTPLAVVDYTRSDDQYSFSEIQEQVLSAGVEKVNLSALSVFSLNYSVSFRHSAVNLPNALKTTIGFSIANAPSKLSSLVNVQQIVGQESALSLQDATQKIIDAQNQFPHGVFVFQFQGPTGLMQTIKRKFIVYGTTFNFDAKRVNSTLQIRAASFDSMVMRLKLNLDIKKTKPLFDQIQTALKTSSTASTYSVTCTEAIGHLMPVVERYYPPAPLNKILGNVCRDNGIFFDIDEDQKIVHLQSLKSDNTPSDFFPKNFCFRGYYPGANLISTFSVQDYATASFGTEVADISLFDSVNVWDDSDAEGLFANFRSGEPYGLKMVFSYLFYVLEYELHWSSYESRLVIRGTNNWLISNFKLDTLFENAVYSGVSAQ